MKQKFGKSFVLIPIGLLLLSGTMALNHFATIPDLVSGLLVGTAIGLIAFPLISKRIRPGSC